MTTSWTAADIAALEKAIGKGVRTVTYQTGSVTYHSSDEMLKLLDRMRSDVNGSAQSQVIFAGRIR